MSNDGQILYSLTLTVRGSKMKAGNLIETTIPYKIATAHGIEPGDTLDVDVIRHHKPKSEEES
jgi:hypothetical protein